MAVVVKKWPFNCAYRVIGWPRVLLNSILYYYHTMGQKILRSHIRLCISWFGHCVKRLTPSFPKKWKMNSEFSQLFWSIRTRSFIVPFSWKHAGSSSGILLPKLFLPTVRKNCSSDREKLLKFEAEGQEFAKRTIFGNRMLF